MGKRRRRKEPDGGELVIGIFIILVGLFIMSGVSLSTILTNLLWGLLIFIFVGFFIWFFRGMIKASEPIDLKTGKSKSAQRKINIKAELAADAQPSKWTRELIADIEWRVFEKLCMRLWQEKNFTAKETGPGADGGVDFYLYANATQQKIGAVQCKSWSKKQIGVGVLRELQGVVASEQLKLGLLMYSGKLSKAAMEFISNPAVSIKAQSDAEILDEINKLSATQQSKLLAELTSGDYKMPSCPNCDIKLVQRTAKKSGKPFLGCANFPRCKHITHR